MQSFFGICATAFQTLIMRGGLRDYVSCMLVVVFSMSSRQQLHVVMHSSIIAYD